MAYSKTTWNNGLPPAITGTNLNKMETGIGDAHDHMANTSNPHSTTAVQVGAEASGAVATHNSSGSAHSDIRTLVGNVQTEVTNARGGQVNLDARLDGLDTQLAQITNYSNKISTDFFGSVFAPWTGGSLVSGTATTNGILSTKTHQGMVNISSSTGANSGYRYYTGSADHNIKGGEKSTFIFKTPIIDANSVIRFGFQTPVDHNTQFSQIAISVAGTTLSGKTSKTSTESTTASTYTLADNTWYRAVLTVNQDATSVLFELYADDSETLLWSDTLTVNIPNGYTMYHGLVAYNTGTTSKLVIYADYMDFELTGLRRVE